MGDLLEVGHVLKAHGVKGEIRIAFNADSPALLSGFIYLQKKTDRILPIRHNVYRRRSERGSLLLCLEGIEDRDAAEALRGMRILVPRQRLPRLPAGELYLSELPGLEVWTLGE